MRIGDLQSFGLSRRIIELWRGSGLDYLLPIQEEAVKQFGLLDGNDMLISAPTSAGKTFCGELAALKAISHNKKAIILTPLKAIAIEKYNEFKRRYRKLGLKVIVVSADYPENKSKFIRGEYDLALVVYEMLNSLTAASLGALGSVGVIVFDEFQLVSTVDRGIVYESVLAKIRYLKSRIQFIGLIGGLTDCRLFQRWLKVPLLNATNRPVELYRGVLFNGKFSFARYNDCREGTEYFISGNSADNQINHNSGISDELVSALKYLTDKGEQALIFVASKKHSGLLAASVADILKLKPAEKVIENLEDIPDTIQKSELLECLKKGVAFHNADFSAIYRKILEDGFRDSSIKVMVCTSTLAMGVNLPSKNVFIEPERFYDDLSGSPILRPLNIDDYNQIAGRAGRLGQADDFGRAVIIAGDDNQCERIRQTYLDGSAGVRVELFDTEKLAALALGLISCGLIRDYNDARDMLKASLRGFIEGFENNVPVRIIDFLNMHGFITLKGCRLICSELGRAAVMHNIELNTAAAIKDGFIKYKLADKPLSWLYYLTGIPELRRNLLYHRNFSFCDPVIEYMNSLLNRHDEYPSGPLQSFIENPDPNGDPSRINTLMLLADMIQPIPAIDLERKYHAGWGRLKRIGEAFSNALSAAAETGPGNGLSKEAIKYLKLFAERLYYGLPEQGLAFARLNIPMLERDFILRLLDAGVSTPEDVPATDIDFLASILPERVARVLFDLCSALADRADEDESLDTVCPRRPGLKAVKEGGRYKVEISGKTISLQPRLYKYLHKLHNTQSSEGWVDKNLLDSGLNQVKYIYKLRQALKAIDGVEIESDGAGRYRLRLSAAGSIPERVDSATVVG